MCGADLVARSVSGRGESRIPSIDCTPAKPMWNESRPVRGGSRSDDRTDHPSQELLDFRAVDTGVVRDFLAEQPSGTLRRLAWTRPSGGRRPTCSSPTSASRCWTRRHRTTSAECCVLRDGEVVTVTDGAGRWRPCVMSADGLEPAGEVVSVAASVSPATIAVAPPKGDRLDWLVQKCTEVGIDRLVLVSAERSVVRWDAERAERQLERLRRVASEAALQSRRVWLPEVVGPVPAADGAAGGRRCRARRPAARPWVTVASRSVRRAGGRLRSWRWRGTGCRSATPCCASRPRRWSRRPCSSPGAGT